MHTKRSEHMQETLRVCVWSVALADAEGAACFLSGVDQWVGVEA